MTKMSENRRNRRLKTKGRTDGRMVHKLIRTTAKEMAGHYYEFMAHSDQFYADHPDLMVFIEEEWPSFVKTTREILTQMLTGNYPEAYKQEIYEALLQDATLPYSVQETQIVNVPH